MKIRLQKLLGTFLVAAVIFAGCSNDSDKHKHSWSTEYASDATTHWIKCSGCTEIKDKSVHTAAVLSRNETNHWKVCDVCGGNYEVTAHTWNHEDYQYDSESGKEIRTCTECSYVDDQEHQHATTAALSKDGTNHWKVCDACGGNYEVTAHTGDTGTITIAPTCVTKGVRTYKCTVCEVVLRTEEIPALYSSPVDAETGLAATSSSIYIYFGVFPKTVLPETSDVTVDENVSVTMGANTYYKGSDRNYYARVKENCCGSSGFTYTDGTTVKQSNAYSSRYFKVEPVKWKVLTNNYNNTGKALLLAEDILTANVQYYVLPFSERTIGINTVYPNNYKYSTIRAYLNGKYESEDTQAKTAYVNTGFLQTAFTATAQALIADTEVDNSKETTGHSESSYAATYACENTTDKIFLLSESEVINSDYGFAAYNSYGEKNARIRVTTDFAKANCAYQSKTNGYGGYWRLRSPFYDYSFLTRFVCEDGNVNRTDSVNTTNNGVVPALSISF